MNETCVEHSSDCIEEPAMRVDLLLIFRLDDQDNLNRDQVERIVAVWKHKLGFCIDGQLGGILLDDRNVISIPKKTTNSILEY